MKKRNAQISALQSLSSGRFGIAVLILGLIAILGGGCGIHQAQNDKLATEVSIASTEINQTIEADWTATVTETLPPTETPVPTLTATATEFVGTATPDERPLAENWQSWPVIPEISETAKRIFFQGVNEFGTNPRVFSKIGDCQSVPNVFMGIYGMGYEGMLSEEDQYLQTAIDYFHDSFLMESLAVHDGMSVGSALTTTWSDAKICEKGENPINCELRVHNPSIMFVNLGTNWVDGLGMDVYYEYLAEIVDILVSNGVLPILTSKADNVEGGNWINRVTAQVARDYDVPFYNFWAVSQYLTNQGLSAENNIYLTVGAWDYRNYHALRLLNAVGEAMELFTPGEAVPADVSETAAP